MSTDKPMMVAFRTDASVNIGSGHVMRCLTLADELMDKGCEIVFICRELSGNLISVIENKSYPVCTLKWKDSNNAFNWEKDASETIECIQNIKLNIDVIIVDHYQLGIQWESRLRSYTNKIMVIDDLADRNHDCDFILDQNYYSNFESRYDELVPESCRKFLGPNYLLLRSEYANIRKEIRFRDGTIKQILIFFGSSDPSGLTLIALKAMSLIDRKDIRVSVVVGFSNPNRKKIEAYCANKPNMTYYCQIDNMAELMGNADLAIGAGGASMWERCFLGLPTITVVLAANQTATTLDVARYGAIKYLGWSDTVSKEDYIKALQCMISSPERTREISEKSRLLMGKTTGSGSRIVADALLNSKNEHGTKFEIE